MTTTPSTSKRKIVHSEGREIIAKVYDFLKREVEFTQTFQDPNCDLSHLFDVRKRTAEATGVSQRTVSRILKEQKELPSSSSSFTSPLKKRKKRDNKVDLDSLNVDVVRSTIQTFHIVHKEIPTLAKLKSVLNEKIGFDGCLATLRQLLLKLGYKWRKTNNNRKVLTERYDIQLWRFKYLKKIAQYRSEGRSIVYTDESYVLTTHVRSNTWGQKNEATPFMKKISMGTRFILVHAGTEEGFIENACLVYKANSSTGDYHSNMSFDNYVKWLNEKLLPNLPEKAVIVLDNASYHNTRASKIPTSTSSKSDMRQWLIEKGIPFEENHLKVELYEIIKKNKSDHITFKIDQIIKSKGFDVLRLPPYHPELNAIENIWGVLKNYIASKNVDQNMTSTEKLIHEGLTKIDRTTWHKTCKHVESVEKEYMKYFNSDVEFIIHVEDDSESESTDSNDSFSE